MLILIGVLVSIIVSFWELKINFEDTENKLRRNIILKNIYFTLIFTIFIWKYLLGYGHFLNLASYTALHYVSFALVALAVSETIVLLRQKNNYCANQDKGAIKIASIVMVLIGIIIILLTHWFTLEYDDLRIDHLIVTYLSPVTGSSMVDLVSVIEGPIFDTLFLVTLFILFVFAQNKKATKSLVKIHKFICITIASLTLISSLAYCANRFQLLDVYSAYFRHSTFIEEHYKNPKDLNLKFPEKKRNLIHIYLESVENSYMSKADGGFMDKDLMPELTAIAKEGYSFSHNDKFGGPIAASGTTWSIASMVNMATGLPMKVPARFTSYATEGEFLPGAIALGDILEEAGYEQSVMIGADAQFGNLDDFFVEHGNFNVLDYQYYLNNGYLPEDYFVWWGFEDDKLFEFAKQEISRLSKTGKPFHFVMETADTHRPDGYLSPNAEVIHDNQYANVISYNAKEVEHFLRWIQSQDFYEDTTVVIIGDHLSMETNFFHYYGFDDNYQRSQYNVILNPSKSLDTSNAKYHNRLYANYDMFPTIMSSLGIEYDGNKLGLGTNLFSGEKTIFEELGYEECNKEIIKNSDFYNYEIFKIKED